MPKFIPPIFASTALLGAALDAPAAHAQTSAVGNLAFTDLYISRLPRRHRTRPSGLTRGPDSCGLRNRSSVPADLVVYQLCCSRCRGHREGELPRPWKIRPAGISGYPSHNTGYGERHRPLSVLGTQSRRSVRCHDWTT
jgi:hypothetical protein